MAFRIRGDELVRAVKIDGVHVVLLDRRRYDPGRAIGPGRDRRNDAEIPASRRAVRIECRGADRRRPTRNQAARPCRPAIRPRPGWPPRYHSPADDAGIHAGPRGPGSPRICRKPKNEAGAPGGRNDSRRPATGNVSALYQQETASPRRTCRRAPSRGTPCARAPRRVCRRCCRTISEVVSSKSIAAWRELCRLALCFTLSVAPGSPV